MQYIYNFFKGNFSNVACSDLQLNNSNLKIIFFVIIIKLMTGTYKISNFIFQVGGELYFSDVYADKVVPEELRKHSTLWGWYYGIVW